MKKYHVLSLLAALLMLVSACGGKTDPELAENPDDVEQEQMVSEGSEAPAAETLLYKNEKAAVRLVKNETGDWFWREDENFPLDQSCVQQLLDQVAGLTALTPIEQPGELKDYDLDEPDQYLTVTRSDGGSTTYYLGSSVETGGNYMYRDDDPGKIYIVPAAWIQLISRSIYDMAVLPQLPSLTVGQIRSVEIAGAEGTVPNRLTVDSGQQGELWYVNGTPAQEETAGLPEVLQAMAVDRCVDYAPSAGAAEVCGLTQPQATITVTYTNTLGAENTLTLRLGNACAGGYYVLIDEDTTIYRLPQATGDVLLTLAPGAGAAG